MNNTFMVPATEKFTGNKIYLNLAYAYKIFEIDTGGSMIYFINGNSKAVVKESPEELLGIEKGEITLD